MYIRTHQHWAFQQEGAVLDVGACVERERKIIWEAARSANEASPVLFFLQRSVFSKMHTVVPCCASAEILSRQHWEPLGKLDAIALDLYDLQVFLAVGFTL
jgi:hypothetical protein